MTVREELSKISGDTITVADPVQFLGVVEFTQLPEQPISQTKAGDTTPVVLNLTRITPMNSSAVNVTNFIQAQEGQELKILGDGFTTVVNGTYVKTNTGANKLLATNKVYTFTLFNRVWVENA